MEDDMFLPPPPLSTPPTGPHASSGCHGHARAAVADAGSLFSRSETGEDAGAQGSSVPLQSDAVGGVAAEDSRCAVDTPYYAEVSRCAHALGAGSRDHAAACGAGVAALAPAACMGMDGIRMFTRAEHQARFKTSWSALREQSMVGEGSYGSVFMHFDNEQNEFVAFKQAKRGTVLWEEARLLRACAGPHIVTLIGVVFGGVASPAASAVGDGLILEYCSESLEQHWRKYRGLLPKETQLTCAKHLLRGVAHMHERSIVHLDLAPKNLLMLWGARDGLRLKIADLGLSSRLPPSDLLPGCQALQQLPFSDQGRGGGQPGPHTMCGRVHSCTAHGRSVVRHRRHESARWVPTSWARLAECRRQVAPPPAPGHSRACWAQKEHTMVTTMPWRAPEVSLGLPFGRPADMWAVAVVCRELATGRRLWELAKGVDQASSLEYAAWHAGPFTEATWPGVSAAPLFERPPPDFVVDRLDLTRFGQADGAATAFVRWLLCSVPEKRPTAAVALLHGYIACCGKRVRLRSKARLDTPRPAAMPQVAAQVALPAGAVGTGTSAGLAPEPASPLMQPEPLKLKPPASGRKCVCKGNCGRTTEHCDANWGRVTGGCKKDISDTEEALVSEVCRSCRCEHCPAVRRRGDTCRKCSWRLLPPAYQSVRAFAATLQWMLPVDAVAFAQHASPKHLLLATLLAQLWCPVSVDFVATFCGAAASCAAMPKGRKRKAPGAGAGSGIGPEQVANALAALAKSLAAWCETDAPQWKWRMAYCVNLNEGGGGKHWGPETLLKRVGLLQPVVVTAGKGVLQIAGSSFKLDLKTCMSRLVDFERALLGAGAAEVSRCARAGSSRVLARFATMCKQTLAAGQACSWSGMATASTYVRPHVDRKLLIMLLREEGFSLESFPWKALSAEELASLGPDMKENLKAAPSFWRAGDFVRLDNAGGQLVSPIMHSAWACLFGYLMSEKGYYLSKNLTEPPADWIRRAAAGATEIQEAFQASAMSLYRKRQITPTPAQVVRNILHRGSSKDYAGATMSWDPGEAPSCFHKDVPPLPSSWEDPPPEDPWKPV